MAKDKLPTAKQAWKALLAYNRKHGVKLVLAKMKRNRGEAWLGRDKIRLHPKYDMLPTLVHELLHFAYPDMREKNIRRLEDNIASHITLAQYKRLLRIVLAQMII